MGTLRPPFEGFNLKEKEQTNTDRRSAGHQDSNEYGGLGASKERQVKQTPGVRLSGSRSIVPVHGVDDRVTYKHYT